MGKRQFQAQYGFNANDHRVERVADAPFGAMLDAINQQVALRLRGLNVVARRGDLPVPALDKPIPDGSQYLVHFDFNGNVLDRIYTWRELVAQASPSVEQLDGTSPTSAATTAVQTGEWISSTLKDWVLALRTDPNPATDREEGDLRLTNELDHEEIWDFDGTAWQNLYSADRVKAWIAALNLFEGTAHEDGTVVPGAVEFSALPDLTKNLVADADLSAHYYTFVGAPGYVVKAGDPNGLGSDLNGAILNPGDWIQVVNRGTPVAPDLHWVHIGGDLLAKSRGDNLYGLKPWRAGSWEVGSLVTYEGDVYRALQGVVASDPSPLGKPPVPVSQALLLPAAGGLTGDPFDSLPNSAGPGQVVTATAAGQITMANSPFANLNYATGDSFVYVPDPAFAGSGTTAEGFPFSQNWVAVGQVSPIPNPLVVTVPSTGSHWEKVNIGGGLKVAQTDPGGGTGSLPLTAPAGQVWIVLQSAVAGNRQALFAYDGAAQKWQELGGGGVPMDLSGGDELIGVGLPIGSITAYVRVDLLPPGWLLCDGNPIPANYKELINICGANTPDLRDQFIRGAKAQTEVWDNGFVKHQDTTRLPRKAFTAAEAGEHLHVGGGPTIASWAVFGAGDSGSHEAWSSGTAMGRVLPNTSSAGRHTHAVTGGDPETAPAHVRLAYIIKAADRTALTRLP